VGEAASTGCAPTSRASPDATPAELDDLLRDAVRSYARYWCEVFRLPVTPRERVLSGTTTDGEQRLRDAVAAGAVSCSPAAQRQLGRAGYWLTATGVPFTTVAERLRPESLYDRFVAFRESLGMEVLPLTGGARPPYDVLVERLERAGRCACWPTATCRRAASTSSCSARPPACPPVPASLALRTGRALIP
jgi:KDO2-lipid IV(A) lauroyltransferase